MCRAIYEGGRRCPGNCGENRRAYQRQRYALKIAAGVSRSRAQIADPEPPEYLTTAAAAAVSQYASPTEAEAVYRDPVPTRNQVDDALHALRDTEINQAQWRNSPEFIQYVASVVTHGSVLRDNTLAAATHAWEEAGVADHQLQPLIEERNQVSEQHKEANKLIHALMDEHDRLKRENPGWIDDPEMSAKIKRVGDQWATMMDEWNNRVTAVNRRVLEINKTRSALFQEQVKETLAAERDLGGTCNVSEKAKLTKADKAMFESVVGSFPADMVAFANDRIPVLPKRSRRRAHYASGRRQRVKKTYAGVLTAEWGLEGRLMRSTTRFVERTEDGTPEVSPFWYGQTVEDTPSNWDKLNETVNKYLEEKPNTPPRKRPKVTRTEIEDYDGNKSSRLYVYIPEAHSRFTHDYDAAPVGELTFSDDRSMTHEFGHHVEANNPEVGFACKEFLAHRTKGLAQEHYAGRGRNTELVVPDGFVERYIGKDYPTDAHHTEIFSVGCEAVLKGEYGGLLGIEVDTMKLATEGVVSRHKKDPEHFALVMGLLASANKKLQPRKKKS